MLDLDYNIIGSLIGLSGNRFVQQSSLGNLGKVLRILVRRCNQSIKFQPTRAGFEPINQFNSIQRVQNIQSIKLEVLGLIDWLIASLTGRLWYYHNDKIACVHSPADFLSINQLIHGPLT